MTNHYDPADCRRYTVRDAGGSHWTADAPSATLAIEAVRHTIERGIWPIEALPCDLDVVAEPCHGPGSGWLNPCQSGDCGHPDCACCAGDTAEATIPLACPGSDTSGTFDLT